MCRDFLKSGDIIKTTTSDRSITIDRDLRPYYEQAEEHPIKTLMDAGIPVCLGSDNPLLMNTNIGKEYSMSHKAGVTETSDHLQITRNAIMNANVDAVTRGRLLSHIDDYTIDPRPTATSLGYKRVELSL